MLRTPVILFGIPDASWHTLGPRTRRHDDVNRKRSVYGYTWPIFTVLQPTSHPVQHPTTDGEGGDHAPVKYLAITFNGLLTQRNIRKY